MKEKILFDEKQKFTQWWLWLILLAPAFYIMYALFSPLFSSDTSNTDNFSVSFALPTESWFALLILVLILLFMGLMTMHTHIDSEKIVVRHLFFVKKEWFWKDIESTELITYGFVGYGIRISLNYGTVYNIKGNKGLFLKLKNGKKRLIGTQRTKELGRIVQSIM